MPHKRLLLILPAVAAALLLYRLGFQKSPEPRPAGDGDYRVICAGDSLTAGTGSAPGAAYPAKLASLLSTRGIKAEVLNLGRAYSPAAELRSELVPVLGSGSAGAVILLAGRDDYRIGGKPGFFAAASKIISGRNSGKAPDCSSTLLSCREASACGVSGAPEPGRLAEVCRAEGQPEEALRLALAAAEVSPGDPAAASRAGLLLLELGRVEEALVHYEAALKISPRHSAALAGKGVCLLYSGRPVEAAKVFEKERAISPGDPSAHFRLGLAYAAAGELKKAGYWHEQGIAADPAYRLNYSALGWLDIKAKKYGAAQDWFLWAITEKTDQPAPSREDRLALAYNLKPAGSLSCDFSARPRGEGWESLGRREYERALGIFEAASAAAPGDQQLRLGRAAALSGLGRRAEAVGEVIRGLEKGPVHAEFYRLAGDAFRDSGLGEEALRWYAAGASASDSGAGGCLLGIARYATEAGLYGPARNYFSGLNCRGGEFSGPLAALAPGGPDPAVQAYNIRKGLSSAAELARKKGLRVIIATYPEAEPTPRGRELALLAREAASASGAELLDLQAAFGAKGKAAAGYFGRDGRPNARGYGRMAELAADKLAGTPHASN